MVKKNIEYVPTQIVTEYLRRVDFNGKWGFMG